MDSRKIVEVLRATLDAHQQAQAHEQLQQVRIIAENCAKSKHMEMTQYKKIKIPMFFDLSSWR